MGTWCPNTTLEHHSRARVLIMDGLYWTNTGLTCGLRSSSVWAVSSPVQFVIFWAYHKSKPMIEIVYFVKLIKKFSHAKNHVDRLLINTWSLIFKQMDQIQCGQCIFFKINVVRLCIDQYPINIIFCTIEVLDRLDKINDFNYCCGLV